jgi:hypothetical protein
MDHFLLDFAEFAKTIEETFAAAHVEVGPQFRGRTSIVDRMKRSRARHHQWFS